MRDVRKATRGNTGFINAVPAHTGFSTHQKLFLQAEDSYSKREGE